MVEIKFNKWVFTSWKKPTLNTDNVKYLVWQKEYCPTTKLEHYQGYVVFKKDYKLFQVKSLFKDKAMYVDKARENDEINRLYCTKNESFADERYEFGDIDTGISKKVTSWEDLDI